MEIPTKFNAIENVYIDDIDNIELREFLSLLISNSISTRLKETTEFYKNKISRINKKYDTNSEAIINGTNFNEETINLFFPSFFNINFVLEFWKLVRILQISEGIREPYYNTLKNGYVLTIFIIPEKSNKFPSLVRKFLINKKKEYLDGKISEMMINENNALIELNYLKKKIIKLYYDLYNETKRNLIQNLTSYSYEIRTKDLVFEFNYIKPFFANYMTEIFKIVGREFSEKGAWDYCITKKDDIISIQLF